MTRTLVFFPSYNEAGNVRSLVAAIRAELPGAHILSVDDASTDGSPECVNDGLRRHRVLVDYVAPRCLASENILL